MSLANKLSVYMLLITVVIFVSIGYIYQRYGARREERLVSMYAAALVDKSVEKLDSSFDRVEDHLEQHAPMVKEALGRRDDIMGLVEHIVRSDTTVIGASVAYVPGVADNAAEPLFMEYIAVLPDGTLDRMHLGGTDYHYTGKQWFTDVLRADTGLWSEPYYDRGAGNRMMTTYSYPIHDSDGRIAAVITADLSLEELGGEIEHLRPIDDSYSFIISSKGTYIAHPDSNIVKLSENIFRRYPAAMNAEIASIARHMTGGDSGTSRLRIDGKDVLAVYEPIPRSGWSICTVCSYDSVMAQLGSATFAALCILALGLVALILLIRLTLIYSMKPLARLTQAAGEISHGNMNVSLPPVDADSEIDRLNDAFATMQASLRRQMQQLVETTRAKEHIESELQIARNIQMNMLPHRFSPFDDLPGLELYAMVRPAKEVGGDLYDFFSRDGKLFFAIGDVSGKGVPAALFMAVTRTLFRYIAETVDSPARIITRLNNCAIQNNDACMFVTMFAGVLDTTDGTLRFCNAGHNPAVIVSGGQARMLSEKENLPVGVFGDYDYEEETITLGVGETLFMYTDGLTEAEDSAKALFGDERMLRLLADNSGKTPELLIDAVAYAVAAFADGTEQSDDLTMMALRRTAASDDAPDTAAADGSYHDRLVSDNTDAAVAAVAVMAARLGDALGLGAAVVNNICLAVEEAVVNVVSYSYPAGVTGPVILDMSCAGGIITVTITDNGTPFNPTAQESADTEAPLDERAIGGLGIHLIRALADTVAYRRENGSNILTIRFNKS